MLRVLLLSPQPSAQSQLGQPHAWWHNPIAHRTASVSLLQLLMTRASWLETQLPTPQKGFKRLQRLSQALLQQLTWQAQWQLLPRTSMGSQQALLQLLLQHQLQQLMYFRPPGHSAYIQVCAYVLLNSRIH